MTSNFVNHNRLEEKHPPSAKVQFSNPQLLRPFLAERGFCVLGFGKDVDLFMSGRACGFIGEGGRMGVMQT